MASVKNYDTVTERDDDKTPSRVLGKMAEFSQETSLHGIKFVLQTSVSKPRRILWTVVIVAQLVFFLGVVIDQIIHVTKLPILTKTVTSYEDQLAFPAVTVCKPLSTLTHPALDPFENDVMENLAAPNRTFFTSIPMEDYLRIDTAKIHHKRFLLEEKFLRFCMFAHGNCSQLIKTSLAVDSLCETVNSVLPDERSWAGDATETDRAVRSEKLISRTPGLEAGLKLLLKLGREDRGVKLILHQPDEKIRVVNSEFVQLSPFSEHFIGVDVYKDKFLPQPYQAFRHRKCQVTTGDFRHPLVPTGRYTLRACQDACLIEGARNFCGCAVDYISVTKNEKMCDPLRIIDCQNMTVERFLNNSLTVPLCDCPLPCEDLAYYATLSSTPKGNVSDKDRENHVLVHIHFNRLKIVSSEQVPDYTTGDVFASIGGQMGLFLGASIITVTEVLELMIRCLYGWVKRVWRKAATK